MLPEGSHNTLAMARLCLQAKAAAAGADLRGVSDAAGKMSAMAPPGSGPKSQLWLQVRPWITKRRKPPASHDCSLLEACWRRLASHAMSRSVLGRTRRRCPWPHHVALAILSFCIGAAVSNLVQSHQGRRSCIMDLFL